VTDQDVQGVGRSKVGLVGELKALADGLSAVVTSAGPQNAAAGAGEVSPISEVSIDAALTDSTVLFSY
jgi:hypothetical protein